MSINCKNGVCNRCWKRVIDFQIKVDPRILQAILPEMEKMFAHASKSGSLCLCLSKSIGRRFCGGVGKRAEGRNF